jgi:hypothetical protein
MSKKVLFEEKDLQPGDILLYRSNSLFGLLIRLKTGGRYSHCEIYIGNGKSWASRDGIGVGEYNLDLTNLKAVLRANNPELLDFDSGKFWFENVAKGQKYDWIGLLNFYIAKWQGRENDRMFCSEYVCRQFRAFNYPLFPRSVDCDSIHPSAIEHSTKVSIIKRG